MANGQRQLATHPSQRYHHAHQRLPLASATHHRPKRRHLQEHQLLDRQKTRGLQKMKTRSLQQIKAWSKRLRQHSPILLRSFQTSSVHQLLQLQQLRHPHQLHRLH